MRALPFTFREVEADLGTVVSVTVTGEAGGNWHVERRDGGWAQTAPVGDGHRDDGPGHGLEAGDEAPQPGGEPAAVPRHSDHGRRGARPACSRHGVGDGLMVDRWAERH